MHQSFVTTAPHQREWVGDSRANVQGTDLLIPLPLPLQCRVSAGFVIVHKYTQVEFTIIKSTAMTRSRSRQCRTFSRAAMNEMLLSLLFPVCVCVGGGRGAGVAQWLQMIGALPVHTPVRSQIF